MDLHRLTAPPAELMRAALQEVRRGRTAEVVDRVAVVLQPGLRPIHADPLRVTQAVTHLLNYGIATLAPGTTNQVVLRALERERDFVIELAVPVELPPDEAELLWSTFRAPDIKDAPRAQAAGGAPRPGLGGLHLTLPLARRLAELHDGSLELASRAPLLLRMVIPDLGRETTRPGSRPVRPKLVIT
jgi:hypothetical protein